MMTKAGFISLILGIAAADSDKLWVPMALIAIGAALLLAGERRK